VNNQENFLLFLESNNIKNNVGGSMPFQKINTAHKNRKIRFGGGRKPSPIKAERDALARDKQNAPNISKGYQISISIRPTLN
jgi:hypothetical protein